MTIEKKKSLTENHENNTFDVGKKNKANKT